MQCRARGISWRKAHPARSSVRQALLQAFGTAAFILLRFSFITLYALHLSKNLSRSCCITAGSRRACTRRERRRRRARGFYLLRLLRLHGLVAQAALLVLAEASEALLKAEVLAYDNGAADAFVGGCVADGQRWRGLERGEFGRL